MSMVDYLREKVGVPSKLEKLTLIAYAGMQMPLKPSGSLVAAFNPETITFTSAVNYHESHKVDSPHPGLTFESESPGNLALTLIFDAQQKSMTGSVDDQILHMRTLCTGINQKQETNYLSLKWGKMRWSATRSVLWRAREVTVTFTLFDRDGTPLRAEAALSLVPVPQPSETANSTEGSLTSKVVRSSDLLPVLAAAAGTQSDYLIQAKENLLNSINLPTDAIGSTLVLRNKLL